MSIPNANHGANHTGGSTDLECGWKTLDEDDCDMWPERKLIKATDQRCVPSHVGWR